MAKKLKWIQTPEGKAATSARMKAYWAARKANGAERPKRTRRRVEFPRIEAHMLQEMALYGARQKLSVLNLERERLEQFIKRGGKW